jgi:ABC-type branched-subunit amino acid transport system ATPase component
MEEILRVEKVVKKFGEFVALNNISLSIYDQKGVTAIIGPNGAGKTTLINVITGRLRPDAGKIFFEGRDITSLPPHKIVQLGIVRTFQVINLFSELTVYQNLNVANLSKPRTLRKDLHEVMELFDLDKYRDIEVAKLPHGIQRIVQIAVAFTLSPKLLLLDEPLAGLNIDEKTRIVNVVKDLAKNIPVVLIEHDLHVVFDISNRIVVMHRGEVIAEGTPDEVYRNPVVKEIYIGL